MKFRVVSLLFALAVAVAGTAASAAAAGTDAMPVDSGVYTVLTPEQTGAADPAQFGGFGFPFWGGWWGSPFTGGSLTGGSFTGGSSLGGDCCCVIPCVSPCVSPCSGGFPLGFGYPLGFGFPAFGGFPVFGPPFAPFPGTGLNLFNLGLGTTSNPFGVLGAPVGLGSLTGLGTGAHQFVIVQ